MDNLWYGCLPCSCAVAVNGSVWCQGIGTSGQLGNNATSNSAGKLVQVVSAQTFITVSLSTYATCATTNVNRLFCWGKSDFGMVGGSSSIGFWVAVAHTFVMTFHVSDNPTFPWH